MAFTINDKNLTGFLYQGNLLVIDNTLLSKTPVSKHGTLVIENINDINLTFAISKVNVPNLEIEIKDCTFRSVVIDDSTLNRVSFRTVIVSAFKEEKFKLYKFSIDNSTIQSLDLSYCTIFNGIVIGNKSSFYNIDIDYSKVDYSFTFFNALSKKITFESSNLENISLDNDDHSEKKAKTCIDVINIFRTEITKNIKIYNASFETITIYKIKFIKSESLIDHLNEIFISPPKYLLEINEISIMESTIPASVRISANHIKSLSVIESSIKDFSLTFSEISKHGIYDSQFSGSVYYGLSNNLKTIRKFIVENVIFDGSFNLNNTSIEEECTISGTVFKKHPSFFTSNFIEDKCKTNFKHSNLQNLVFQEVDFLNFGFENFDITNATFRDCQWPIQNSIFLKRHVVADELHNVSLVKLKDIYAKLKTNLQKHSDYISYGRFYISEQETKRKIHKQNKEWFEYTLLWFHKSISSYGESIKKPLIILVCFLFTFSVLYLFTGFYNNENLVQYELTFQPKNTFETISSWLKALLLSIKNVIPLPINQNFYLHTEKTLAATQTLELFQKLISLIIATSFTTALIRHFKK